MDENEIHGSEERRELVERAFGPAATAADRQALAAFDAVRGRSTTGVAAMRIAEQRAADGREAANAGEVLPAHALRDPAPRWRRRTTFAVGAGAALLCGIVGVSIGVGIRPPASSSQSGSEVASANLEAVEKNLPAFVAPDFSGRQFPTDIPDVTIPSNLVRSSFRNAGVSDNDPSDPQRFFVAKDTTNYDCVVALHSGQLSSACVSGKYFPASGLTLSWNDGATASVLTWLPDGTMTLSN